MQVLVRPLGTIVHVTIRNRHYTVCINTMLLHVLHRVGHTRVIKCSAHTVVPSKCLPEHDDYACVAMEASTCVNHRCSTAKNNCLGAIGYYATLHAHVKPSSTDTTNAFIRYHTVVVHTTYPDSRWWLQHTCGCSTRDQSCYYMLS